MGSPNFERLSAPASCLFAITKSDSVSLPKTARMIYVGTTGDVVVVDTQGNQVTHKAVPAGTYLGPFQIARVLAAGTSADDMVGYA